MVDKEWTFKEVEELYRTFNPDAIDGEGMRIVVAEGNPAMRSAICSAFKKKGFTVFPAENGLLALNLILREVPDCCILETKLPQMGGLEIAERIRKNEITASVPIVFCTARSTKQDIIAAQKLAAAAYLIKPFEIKTLVQKVGAICGV